MAELYDRTGNNTEPVSAYFNVGLDIDNSSSVIPPGSVIPKVATTPTPPPTKKRLSRNQKIGLAVVIAVIVIFLIVFFTTGSSTLISKYENKSNFSNKDQFEDPKTNDYDIHYLVEQMIYKEFTPKDKKKYLNLPQTLKEQLMFDYLIDKI
jgi:hypothetical protein